MGRELDITLRLPDPSISRHHCVIRKLGGGFEIQDLQSSNGVLVNGNRVQASPLRNGDRITLGQVQLTFQDPLSEVGATVAVSREEANQPPLGTVRMSASELAAIHTGKPKAEAPDAVSTGPIPIAPKAGAQTEPAAPKIRKGAPTKQAPTGPGPGPFFFPAEALTEYDQAFQRWRFLHVQLVERIIGPMTRGTGGSAGAGFLAQSVSQRFFPALWALCHRGYTPGDTRVPTTPGLPGDSAG